MLPPDLEILRPGYRRGRFQAVLFDFDGTLSLLRDDWRQVMVPMMVEVLRETGTPENEADLTATMEEFVSRLNGRSTAYQMTLLAEEVRRRGKEPLSPRVYQDRYLHQLEQRIAPRVRALVDGTARPEDWLVPCSHAILHALQQRGLLLALASGTDRPHVLREGALLGLTEVFGPHVYAPEPDGASFSKEVVVRQLLAQNGLTGEQLLAFGDGPAEVEAVRKVGGVMVGVAWDGQHPGRIHPERKRQLAEAGADLVIPDYRQHPALLRHLFGEE